MKNMFTFLFTFIGIQMIAQKSLDYQTEILINASKKYIWFVITDFKSYPEWDSVLNIRGNDDLIISKKFMVTIKQPNGRQTNFKARASSKEKYTSFAGTQKTIGKWFLQAVHFFIIEEVNNPQVRFIQKWKINDVLASVFRNQILKN